MSLYDTVKQGSYKNSINLLAKKTDELSEEIELLNTTFYQEKFYRSSSLSIDAGARSILTFTHGKSKDKIMGVLSIILHSGLLLCGFSTVNNNFATVIVYNITDEEITTSDSDTFITLSYIE